MEPRAGLRLIGASPVFPKAQGRTMRSQLNVLFALPAMCAFGCASAPSGPPPFDPTGTYQVTAEVDGIPIAGTVVIERAAEGWEGTLAAGFFPPVAFSDVTVDGRKVTISAASQQGPMTVEVEVAPDGEVSGTWSVGATSGAVSGRKESG